jgi:hypothetical protein
MFLTLRQGSSDFILQMRLSYFNFINNNGGLPTTPNLSNPYRYLPVNIPGTMSGQTISLDQSFYQNPTLIVSGIIKLNFWYLTPSNVKTLQERGELLPIGK